MTVKTNLGLVEWTKAWLGQAYWFGTCCYACTQSLLERKAKQYPKSYADNRMNRYRADIATGKKCADCIGLIKGYYWARDDGTQVYGLDGRPDQGANGAYNAAKVKGTIATLSELPGLILWKSGHVGVYIGNGEAIEAKGFNYGIVKTKVKGRGWTHWFRSPYIDYLIEGSTGDAQTGVEETDDHANQPAEGGAEESALDLGTRLLRVVPGQPLMRGSDVLAMQTRLLAKGFAPGKLDGVYGNLTKAAVVALQTACGIKADGVVGPDTRVFLR